MNGTDVGADLYDAVVGQPDAVAQLKAAAAAPLPAYLFLGPQGAGQRAAALAFSADVIARATTDHDQRGRHVRLALSGRHPDVREYERTGPFITAEQAREIVQQASRAPVEVDTQVLVLHDFHLVSAAAPILLTTIEQPPSSTRFIVVASEISPELVTIASRCVRVDFGPVPTSDIAARLVEDGSDAGTAAVVAAAVDGDLDRARMLAGDEGFAARHRAWREVPDRLDGSGSAVVAVVAGLLEALDGAGAHVADEQARERAELDDVIDRYGPQPGEPRRTTDRHKREARRRRTDEIRMGLATLGGRVRELVAQGGDQAAAAAAGRFLQAVDRTLEAVDRYNANERLQLEALLTQYPPALLPEG